MSNKVHALVQSRTVGSAAQKAVLLNMADRASDAGRDVFASKGTIAAETELSLATIKREVKALLDRGLILEAGTRPCANGKTIVYDLDLEAIATLPEWKDGRRIGAGVGQEHAATRPTMNPAHPEPGSPRTPTRFTVNPHPVQGEPQTILEPSLNQQPPPERAGASATVADLSIVGRLTHALGFDHQGITPRYWITPDAALIVARWQTDLGLTPDEILTVAVGNARAHGSPAQGPKTLTRAMQDYAAAKNAPALEPTKGSPNAQSPRTAQPGRRDAGSDQQFSGLAGAAMRLRAAREQGHGG